MPTVRIHGFDVALDRRVYEPAEDSELLARDLALLPRFVVEGRRAADVGTGTGLSAMVLARAGARVVATDANPAACALAAANARANRLRVDVVETDLLAALSGPFDLVVSNPPYLPTSPAERRGDALELALDGGQGGVGPTLRLLDQCATRLAPSGAVLFIASTAAALFELDAHAAATGWALRVVDKAPLGLEALLMFEARRRVKAP